MKRRPSFQALLVVVIGTCFAGMLACRKQDSPSEPRATETGKASDRLAKGELPEGRERAFTLPLPLQSSVKARFQGSIHVVSELSHEELSNFVRARVKDGTTSAGTAETLFDRVVVKIDPSKTLAIQVRPTALTGSARSQMVIRDITPPPEPPGLTDPDRLRNAGLSSDGKLLDRQQLQ